jgi:hypothetical protein
MDKVLSLNFQQQQTTAWCWAAVASMVSGWYAQNTDGQAMSQCDVASATLPDVSSCCSAGSINPDCIKLWVLDQALAAVGHFAGTGDVSDLDTVIGQINANRPLGALIEYSGITHFVLVTGYSDTRQLVVVCDPAGSQPFSTPVTAFFSNYNNGGTWGGWYFTT